MCRWNKTQARNTPFHFKAVHFSNHKARVPVANERIWAFNAFLPFIHGTDDFIQDDTPLQQFRGLAGQAYERRRFLLKQGAEIQCALVGVTEPWKRMHFWVLSSTHSCLLSFPPSPASRGGRKKVSLLSYFYFLISDLIVGLHCTMLWCSRTNYSCAVNECAALSA